jgi:hypothetical protein
MKGRVSCLKERRLAPRLEGGSRRRLLDRPSRRAFGVPQVEVFEKKTEGAKKLRKSAANPLESLVRVNLCAGVALVRRNSTDYGRKGRFPLRYRVKLWRRRHIEFKRRHSDLDPVPDEDLNDGGANPSSSWIVDDDGTRR